MDAFPFEAVVVTFPDEGAAHVAIEGPLKDLQETYPYTEFLATCDPFGCRCGSGGGTLAALEEVVNGNNGNNETQKTILILHAGGDSSRCFTQMALGKAWTNLPCADDCTGKEMLSNPILLCMDSVARIFSQSHRLPQGSIVIAASDCLLSIPHDKKGGIMVNGELTKVELGTSQHDNDDHPMPDVLGVAFPAAWETAKNHGVYVLSEMTSIPDIQQDDTRALEVPIRTVLQKPPLETLQAQPFVTFGSMAQKGDEGLAWIDNGIIAFLPKAAQALYGLAHGILKTTTKSGLAKAMEERKDEPGLTYQDLTHKVDLYTHFLQALTIVGEPGQQLSVEQHLEDYLKHHASNLDVEVAKGIFDALSPLQFQALAIPEGKFLHLGTTGELKDFYVHGCSRSSQQKQPQLSNNNKPTRHELYTKNCTFFGQELGLTRRMDVFLHWENSTSCIATNAVDRNAVIGDNCIAFGCVLEGDTSSSIGEGTVLEFCCLPKTNDAATPPSIRIGKNCLLSGLRHLTTTTSNISSNTSFTIPDDTCIQMMPLLDKDEASSYVVMALGVNDPIKNKLAESTLFGVKIEAFLKWADLSPVDLWEEGESQTIWNARLHPVISEISDSSFISVWDWFNHFQAQACDSVPENANSSLKGWKTHRRLSLKEVRDQSDGAAEFRYRRDLVHTIVPWWRSEYCQRITDILWKRQHNECDFYPLLADTLCLEKEDNEMQFVSSSANQTLRTLDNVISEALLDQSHYDICGRAGMVQSALLDDLAKITFHTTTTIPEASQKTLADLRQQCAPFLVAIQSHTSTGVDRQKAYTEIIALREEYLTATGGLPELRNVLSDFSDIMESIARVMTEICVSGFLHANAALKSKAETMPPIFDQWVIATSPARVDLSGGWTDTPPVCYEYGSFVTGIAVTVDNKKPLSCRCRIVSRDDNDDGIILIRSELRDSKTCDLVSGVDTQLRELRDLQDARDPSADGALVKCALICLGLISLDMLQDPEDGTANPSLQSCVDQFCQNENGRHVRLEIVVTSLLPQGSGMGTSSILGGCVLAAVAGCVGIKHSTFAENGAEGEGGANIIDSVSQLEQILSTGGGFQDQVNGLIGGAKTVSTPRGELPIKLSIQQVPIDPTVQKKLDNRLLLAFTGKTRLAANILQNVLRRFARRTPEIVDCAHDLVEGAHKAEAALRQGDLEALGDSLHDYWTLKKHMAGSDVGVEPDIVHNIIEELKQKNLISGASLCGAGGGGFMVLLAAPDAETTAIRAAAQMCLDDGKDDAASTFSWHECHICDEGLTTTIIEVGSDTDFKSWHSPKDSNQH